MIYLCGCGFATDDDTWFSGHQFQHPGHHQRSPEPSRPPMPDEPGLSGPAPGRPHDVSALTGAELERTRRELAASLALARPGSPARVPILAHLAAIDAELARSTRPDLAN